MPGSTNKITIICDGIVKVGYDLSDIKVEVSEDTIYIALPDATVLDNYVIWNTVECVEDPAIFNKIEFSQYKEIFTEIQEKGLKDVEESDIYDKAEEHLKVLIEVFLSEFDDYSIEYM